MTVYSFEPFGYEGQDVLIETDRRIAGNGFPAYDIVGLSDIVAKDARNIIQDAFNASGIDFYSNNQTEHILQSLSPADIKKRGFHHTAAMAASILGTDKIAEPVMVLGELDSEGDIHAVRGVHAAVKWATTLGIKVIVPEESLSEAMEVDGAYIQTARNLSELSEKILIEKSEYTLSNSKKEHSEEITFSNERLNEIKNMDTKGFYETLRAIEIAAAGGHNIMLLGDDNSGASFFAQSVLPALMPALTFDEASVSSRIHGLSQGSGRKPLPITYPPVQIPNSEISVEKFFGGGPECRPGIASLAHNGLLVLEKPDNFSQGILDLLNAPLHNKHITLSYAGRASVYPCDFQIALVTDHIPRKLRNYTKRHIEISNVIKHNTNETKTLTLDEMKEHIKLAYCVQRRFERKNSELPFSELCLLSSITPESKKIFDAFNKRIEPDEKEDLNKYDKFQNIFKVAFTIANMEDRNWLTVPDIAEAIHYTANDKEMTRLVKEVEKETGFDLGITSYEEKLLKVFDPDKRFPFTDESMEKLFWNTVKDSLHNHDNNPVLAYKMEREKMKNDPENYFHDISEKIHSSFDSKASFILTVLEKTEFTLSKDNLQHFAEEICKPEEIYQGKNRSLFLPVNESTKKLASMYHKCGNGENHVLETTDSKGNHFFEFKDCCRFGRAEDIQLKTERKNRSDDDGYTR